MAKISVILITRNSEKILDDVLRSVQSFADEIVIVDDFSADQTLTIVQKFGAKIHSRKMNGFGEQKQFALDQASNEWVFILDSDEIVDKNLAQEVLAKTTNPGGCAAFRLKRRNYYFGKWLRHGGKFPDWQTRLIKKSMCRFSKDLVHEKILVKGRTGDLQYHLNHYSYPDVETWTDKLKTFAWHRGQELYRKKTPTDLINYWTFMFWRPLSRFVRRYFFKRAFLDGSAGLLACLHDALTEILGFIYLRELQQKNEK